MAITSSLAGRIARDRYLALAPPPWCEDVAR
jgi:hypothetical protein